MSRKMILGFMVGVVATVGLLVSMPDSVVQVAMGTTQKQAVPVELSPTKALPERDTYFPGTEDLLPDEMRITACGTGMPSARPKQAAACFLVELGNGDKFLFDIGSGSHERIAAMKIPYDFLDKVFIGHLHVDHYGDLPTFWLGVQQ